MIKKGNLIRVFLVVLFIGTTIFSGIVIWKLAERVRQIRIAEQSDPLWIASRLHFEIMRFDLSLRKYVASNTSPEEIETRFEIAWSRIDVMQTGKVAALLDIFEVDDAVLTSLEVAFKTFEPVIKNLPDQTSSEAERRIVVESILPKIELFEQQLREFTLLLAQSKSNFMSDFRNGLLSLSNTIAILGIVVISLVGIISALLFLDLQASRKVSAHMQILVQEANAAAKMKDKFMSVTSHELRTPLTSILGGISLLKNMGDQGLTSNARKLIDIASRNGERLLSLINDILDVQSLSEGTVSLNRQNINLNELISSTVENCVDFTKQYNVQYSIENLDNELRVVADKTRLSQVLTIFLSNAAKFTSSGDVVQIRVRKVDQWAHVNIVDHGPGITSEEQVNLFSRFHQVNPGTSGPQKSSGLGLSISKQLIELHEGKIGFKPGENRGSTFWFALPLA